jgi:hypothetical protein
LPHSQSSGQYQGFQGIPDSHSLGWHWLLPQEVSQYPSSLQYGATHTSHDAAQVSYHGAMIVQVSQISAYVLVSIDIEHRTTNKKAENLTNLINDFIVYTKGKYYNLNENQTQCQILRIKKTLSSWQR